jgi:hypothetical protein
MLALKMQRFLSNTDIWELTARTPDDLRGTLLGPNVRPEPLTNCKSPRFILVARTAGHLLDASQSL